MRVAIRIQVWLLIREIQLCLPTVHVVSDNQVPETFMPILRYARRCLSEELPLHHVGTLAICVELPNSMIRYTDVFVSYDGRTMALAMGNLNPSELPFTVTFESQLLTGERLVTVDGVAHLLPMTVEAMVVVDVMADDFRQQFVTHLERIDERVEPACIDYREFSLYALTEFIRNNAIDEFELMLRRGKIYERSRGQFHFSTKGLQELQQSVLRGEAKLHEVRAARVANIDPQIEGSREYSAEADAAGYTYLQERNLAIATRRSQLTKWGLLFASAVVFFLAFGFWFGWAISGLLLLVVLVHEFGHAIPMALFGYRNRQILFIPFFGAAAFGEKHDAPAWQQLIVLFMGPLPGIIIPLLVMGAMLFQQSDEGLMFDTHGLVSQIALLALVLNYLNLLPLGFLDGGKIVQILFLSRFVRARFVFQLCSALTFLALALWLQEAIIGIVALFSFLPLPAQWRFGTLVKCLQSRLIDQSISNNSEDLRKRNEVFRMLREPPFDRVLPAQRMETAKQLIEYVEARSVGWPTLIGGMVVYLMSLILPIVFLIVIMVIGDAWLI
ncbi:MAG TPA: site-2 protease family protein [Pirellulaceae bacterium]|nr:site-2 protease family protein [Pirellulaceae bacterium]